ncbi:MAG: SOS response-associated peptidase [Prolixibacteraceae bacterium]|nr:SOS response-associated peptidase [Prolixibacteraceae bacterium]
MCFYYAVVKVNANRLFENGIIREEQLNLFPEQYFVNGFEFPLMPVISDDKPDEIQMFHWGVVPSATRAKEDAVEFLRKYNTLNAKAETLFESRMFGRLILKQRCLVLCSGFFEWRHKEPGKKSTPRYPFYITMKDEGMFVFAGVWDRFTDRETGEIIKTYSIITTPANNMMEIVHNSKNRMPLILPPEKALDWLSPELDEAAIKSFLKPFDSEKMKARPISKINPVLSASNNNPGINAYYEYSELDELIKTHPDFFEQSVDLR